MTDISQAAKERAVELANEAQTEELRFLPIVWEDRDVCELNGPLFALAKYIDKVSGIAERVSQSAVSDKVRYDMLQQLVVKDVDPLADALIALGYPSVSTETRHLKEHMAKAGYKIVKDEG